MAMYEEASGECAVPWVRRVLPRGRTLPPAEAARRHRMLLALLWLHALVVPLWGVDRGFGVVHSVLEGGAIAVCAAAASIAGGRRGGGPLLVALGLLTSSAVIVHLSGGVIEAHFHFFVVIVLLTLYEDWTVFLLAAAFVVLHHGVGGALDPHAVFNHPGAEAHPWRWALVHGAYIATAGLGAIVAWRFNEDLRDRHVGLIAAKDAALQRAAAAERELERRARELERSNRELDEFAAIASHDLSAPLLTVSGFLTLLEERHAGRLDREAEALVGHALSGTQQMQRLIGGLLEYARVGRTALAPEEIDLTAVARDALGTLRAPIEEAGAEIVIDPLPVVSADPRAIGRVLQNLLANAVKFAGDARPVVHVTARSSAEGWEIGVIDNGVGVDSADRTRIFEMFHRPGGDAVAGTGLGLAICERIVAHHGGRIWVDPAPGGGSAFRFTLPERLDPRVVRPAPADAAASAAA